MCMFVEFTKEANPGRTGSWLQSVTILTCLVAFYYKIYPIMSQHIVERGIPCIIGYSTNITLHMVQTHINGPYQTCPINDL